MHTVVFMNDYERSDEVKGQLMSLSKSSYSLLEFVIVEIIGGHLGMVNFPFAGILSVGWFQFWLIVLTNNRNKCWLWFFRLLFFLYHGSLPLLED